MNFFNKIISFKIFCLFCNIAIADDSETNKELLEKAKQITEALEKSDQQEAQQEAQQATQVDLANKAQDQVLALQNSIPPSPICSAVHFSLSTIS